LLPSIPPSNDLALELLFLLLPFRRSRGAIPLGFALFGFLVQLLELLRLFGARLAIAFRTLLTVIRLECHGLTFPESMNSQISDEKRRFPFRFLNL